MRTKWYLFGCGTSLLLVILLFVVSITTLIKSANKTQTVIPNNAALVIQMDKAIPEYSPITDQHFNMVPLSVDDIVKRIKSAKMDPKIKCIVLKPSFFTCGYASLHEIMLALEDFKKSNKKVYAYLNMIGQKDYHLASIADEVYLNPSASAGIILTGVGSNLTFYKDLFDKIGVEFKIVRAGKFKAAGETFSRSSISPEFKANLMELFGDIYGQLTYDIAINRKTEQDSVKVIFEKRPHLIINQQESIDYKMITALVTESDFMKKAGITSDQMISISKYNPLPVKSSPRKIAVLYAIGEITPAKASFGSSNINAKQMKKSIEMIKEDDSIKAVVIRVNSPGGSALESDIINGYIEDLKKVKPVVISMGDVAASGGYYISANANYIFADPYTITGSIGVISMLPDVKKLGNKIGLKSESVGYGKFINAMDTWNGISSELEKSIQESVDDTYLEFKTVVAKGRKKTVEQVDSIAQGKVWSAKGAQTVGLIDEIGSLDQALQKAAKIVNLTDYEAVYYPEKKSLFNSVLEEQFDIQMLTKVLTGRFILEYKPEVVEDMVTNVKKDPILMKLPFMIKD